MIKNSREFLKRMLILSMIIIAAMLLDLFPESFYQNTIDQTRVFRVIAYGMILIIPSSICLFLYETRNKK